MSHTYIKDDNNDTYVVGTWQRNIQGHDGFNKMFVLPDLPNAVSAVNCLNGGIGVYHWLEHIIREY